MSSFDNSLKSFQASNRQEWRNPKEQKTGY
jgi:hypothetical protein